MQTLLKQSIIGGLSFLLLTGIAFSVGSSEPSVFEGEASETRILVRNDTFGNTASAILPYTHSTFTAYFITLMRVNSGHIITLPVSNLTTGNTNNLPLSPSEISKIYITISAVGNNATTSPNYTVQAIDENSQDISGVSQTIQMHNASVTTAAAAITAAENNAKEFTLVSSAASVRGFKVTYSSGNGGTPGSVFYRVKVEYVAATPQDVVDAESFSTDFLTATENKANCTSDTGWSTLQSDYDALSADAKTEFKTNTTNQTIVDARERYNYLIAFNNTLTDFVNAV